VDEGFLVHFQLHPLPRAGIKQPAKKVVCWGIVFLFIGGDMSSGAAAKRLCCHC